MYLIYIDLYAMEDTLKKKHMYTGLVKNMSRLELNLWANNIKLSSESYLNPYQTSTDQSSKKQPNAYQMRLI